MYPDKIRNAQKVLARLAGYVGRIDGDAGPKTLAAARATGFDFPGHWPAGRIAVAAAQVALKGVGFDPGPVDGLYGARTDTAFDLWSLANRGTIYTRPHDVPGPSVPDPGRWPAERDLRVWFGPPASYACTAGRVDVPWRMVLAWDTRKAVQTILCHAEVERSLARILERVADEHSRAEIEALGLHLFGGCYNPRKKRGGTSWSTHAWGIALDFDPLRNRLRQTAETARLAQPDARRWWAAWEDESWTSLGRAKNFDWMHVQAAGL